MKTIKSVLPKAGMIFLIFTLLCGVIYTGVVTGIAQLIFPDNAGGSIIEVDGKKYGCELLGQQYTDEAHMWGRIKMCIRDRLWGTLVQHITPPRPVAAGCGVL